VALRRRHLIELWDDIRQKNEAGSAGSWTAATRVQRSLLMGDFMVVALTNNRFCLKKGAAWSRFAVAGLKRCNKMIKMQKTAAKE
jgi:hypothetical protein